MNVIKKILLIVVGLGIIYSSVVFLLIMLGTKDKPTKNPETILILGARVWGTSEENVRPSTVLKERLDTALPYIKKHPTTPVIVSGGQGEDEPVSEAQVMKDYLVEKGISEKQIILENTSTRTEENIRNAQKKRPLHNVVVVTSDFHLYRAKLLARRAGIKKVSGLPAVSNSSSKTKNYLREIIALGYGLIFDW